MRVASLFLSLSIVGVCQADTSDHRYKKGEHVELWVNKVGMRVRFGGGVVFLLDPRVEFVPICTGSLGHCSPVSAQHAVVP
mmetsp:Transcript_12522/g.29046  ORF Transcript_12522/g.29046 Transcript_12522/m.29046 type:complete len:81 (+) Transcript_12522:56-298(+)